MLNHITIMGRLVKDPELRRTQSGVAVCSFTVAVDRDFQSREAAEKQTDFIDVVAWRQTAEFITKWFGKGRMILIEGEMQTRQYTDKNGNPATWYEIIVDNAHFTGEKTNGGNGNYSNNYGAPPISEPPAGYGGGYSSAPAESNPAPANNTPAADFSAADSDDYPF